MHVRLGLTMLIFSTAILLADGGPGSGGGGGTLQVSLSIPNEMAPPGGMVQMKFMVTQPTPISSGKPKAALITTLFSGTSGIELFCATGDLNGVAMVIGSQIGIQYITTVGAQGTDYPIMTLALPIRADAPIGTQTQFSLDP